jgi:hypothetical protein
MNQKGLGLDPAAYQTVDASRSCEDPAIDSPQWNIWQRTLLRPHHWIGDQHVVIVKRQFGFAGVKAASVQKALSHCRGETWVHAEIEIHSCTLIRFADSELGTALGIYKKE